MLLLAETLYERKKVCKALLLNNKPEYREACCRKSYGRTGYD